MALRTGHVRLDPRRIDLPVRRSPGREPRRRRGRDVGGGGRRDRLAGLGFDERRLGEIGVDPAQIVVVEPGRLEERHLRGRRDDAEKRTIRPAGTRRRRRRGPSRGSRTRSALAPSGRGNRSTRRGRLAAARSGTVPDGSSVVAQSWPVGGQNEFGSSGAPPMSRLGGSPDELGAPPPSRAGGAPVPVVEPPLPPPVEPVVEPLDPPVAAFPPSAVPVSQTPSSPPLEHAAKAAAPTVTPKTPKVRASATGSAPLLRGEGAVERRRRVIGVPRCGRSERAWRRGIGAALGSSPVEQPACPGAERAGLQPHGATEAEIFAGSWGHPRCSLMGPPARRS